MSTKSQLLAYLKRQKGTWVSGESVSTTMAISRSAVWKHIRSLREDGYMIKSSPKKGYLFLDAPDLLFVEEIQDELETSRFGKEKIVYLTETDSTNTRAKELAAGGAPEGTLVIAEKQTSGRGRRGRNWFSPTEMGIYASLILRPSIPPNEAPKIVLITAVAVADALAKMSGLQATIKWPNDILVREKKIAGILTEIGTEMDLVNYVIVGLGINVNTPHDCFPREIRDEATSVFIETGERVSRVNLIRDYLNLFETYYGLFLGGKSENLIERWKKSANIIGRRIMVDQSGRRYTGEVMDIDEDGALLVKGSDGRTSRLFSGDITTIHSSI